MRGVEIRAFRGTRRTSVYRTHLLPQGEFRRIVATAERHGLGLLPTLDPRGRHELGKQEAHALAAETSSLRMSGELADLDHDLTEIAEVARWCARASEDSWLLIEGP